MESDKIHIHSFTSTVVPATCIEKGYTLHRCECGYEHRDNFKPLGNHSFAITEESPATCMVGGERKYVCTVCGATTIETTSPCGHKWGNWNTETFATCTQDGSKFRICSQCGQVEKQVIEATGHNLTSPKKSETDNDMVDYFCKNCGETVTKPKTTKRIRFFTQRKLVKAIIALFIVASLVFGSVILFIPGFHYIYAKHLINEGEYTDAYYHLKECKNFKNANILLNDFYVAYEKTTTYFYSNSDGKLLWKTEYENDERGNSINSKSYHARNGEINEEYLTEEKFINEYTYDKYDRIIYEVSYCAQTDSDSKYIYSETHYEYNNNGYTKNRISYSSNGSKYDETTTRYNKAGYVTYHKTEHNNSNDDALDFVHEYKCEYEYYKNGLPKLQTRYNMDGDKTGEYEYDKKGNITEGKIYGEDTGKVTGKEKYKYDDDGNEILYSYYENGKCIKKYEYEYDKYGNMTKAKNYWGEDLTLQFVTEYNDPIIVYSPKSK